jgi:hypothetical protein
MSEYPAALAPAAVAVLAAIERFQRLGCHNFHEIKFTRSFLLLD